MATATIVTAYLERGQACLEVTVDEGDKDKFGRVALRSYIGRVTLDAAFQALSAAQKKTALVAAAKAERDAMLEPVVGGLAVITGSVSI